MQRVNTILDLSPSWLDVEMKEVSEWDIKTHLMKELCPEVFYPSCIKMELFKLN